MIQPKTISEKLLFTTVRIEIEKEDGKTGTGTGFFFDYRIDEKNTIPMIISNKHLIENSVKAKFFLHEERILENEKQPTGNFFPVVIDKFEKIWIGHADDEIDLCGMPVNPIIEGSRKIGKSAYKLALTNDLIKTDPVMEAKLSAVEEVLMVGYPIGLWDTKNNLPIIRRGTTASHPAIDFDGNCLTIIDVACFPGSSGSPVLIVNEGGYRTKSGGLVVGQDRVIFLGVLSSGPVYTVEGKIVIKHVPTATQVTTETGQMIHLGYIVKAKKVLELCSHIKATLESKGYI